MQRERVNAVAALQHLDRCGVARIDLQGPHACGVNDGVDSEQADKIERPGQRAANGGPLGASLVRQLAGSQ